MPTVIEYIRLSAEALILTIAIEAGVAWLFKLRSKMELGTVIHVNVITNPLLNYLIAVNGYFHLVSQTIILILCLEVIVVLVEWRLMVYVFRREAGKILVLSAVMNAVSCIAGFLLFW